MFSLNELFRNVWVNNVWSGRFWKWVRYISFHASTFMFIYLFIYAMDKMYPKWFWFLKSSHIIIHYFKWANRLCQLISLFTNMNIYLFNRVRPKITPHRIPPIFENCFHVPFYLFICSKNLQTNHKRNAIKLPIPLSVFIQLRFTISPSQNRQNCLLWRRPLKLCIRKHTLKMIFKIV